MSTLYTVQGYYSAVTYVDWLVGRLVAAVDSVAGEEAVVVLTSDHGWALGQHAEWTKMSNCEARPSLYLVISTLITLAGGGASAPDCRGTWGPRRPGGALLLYTLHYSTSHCRLSPSTCPWWTCSLGSHHNLHTVNT